MLACNIIITTKEPGVILIFTKHWVSSQRREYGAFKLTSKENDVRNLGSSNFTSSTLAMPIGELNQCRKGKETKERTVGIK